MSSVKFEGILIHCPFCGHGDIAMHPYDIAERGCELPLQGSDAQFAHCDSCGADGPQSFEIQEAADLWNTRKMPKLGKANE